MSRTKLAVTGAAIAAAGLVGAVAFSGPAFAGSSATATYNCVTDQSPPVSYPGVTSTTTPSGTTTAPKVTISTTMPAPIDIAADSMTTTIKTSAGEFSAKKNPELYGPVPPDPGDPVIVGPLSYTGATSPLTSATLPNAPTPTPGTLNWQLKLTIDLPGTSMDPNVYCARIANSGTITWP